MKQIKIIITGSRQLGHYDSLRDWIDHCLSKLIKNKNNEIVILTPFAESTDSIGERYAKDRNFKCQCITQDVKFGKYANEKQAETIVNQANYLIAFKSPMINNTITNSIIKHATKKGLQTKVKYMS